MNNTLTQHSATKWELSTIYFYTFSLEDLDVVDTEPLDRYDTYWVESLDSHLYSTPLEKAMDIVTNLPEEKKQQLLENNQVVRVEIDARRYADFTYNNEVNEVDEVLHLGDSQYTEVYYSDGEEILDESDLNLGWETNREVLYLSFFMQTPWHLWADSVILRDSDLGFSYSPWNERSWI